MNPEEIQQMKDRLALLESIVNQVIKIDRIALNKNIAIGTNGLRIGTATSQKISFYNYTPIVQWASGTGRQDNVNGGGAAANVGTQWNGNSGTTYYSGGDIVAALKAFGLLSA